MTAEGTKNGKASEATLEELATTFGTTGAKVQGLAAAGAASSGNPVLMGGEDGTGKVQKLPVDSDGASVKQPDATKLKNTEANSGAIKTATELVASAIAAVGAALGTIKGLAVLGSDGANWRAILTNAAGNLIPKSPTAADFKVEEASGAGILAALTSSGAWQLLTDIKAALGSTGANYIKTAVDAVATVLGPAGSVGVRLTHIDSLLDTGGATLNAIQQITAEIQAMRGQTPVPFTWAGLGAAEFVIGPALTAGAKYEVTCVQWDADDDGAGTTDVQLSIGYETGFTPGASQYEVYASATLAFVASVIGIANPYTIGRPFLADGSGQLYGVATPTGGATTNGAGTIWVRRIY